MKEKPRVKEGKKKERILRLSARVIQVVTEDLEPVDVQRAALSHATHMFRTRLRLPKDSLKSESELK